MENNFDEYVKIKEKEWDLAQKAERDIALSAIPGILAPGLGTVVSLILIGKRYKRLEKDVNELR